MIAIEKIVCYLHRSRCHKRSHGEAPRSGLRQREHRADKDRAFITVSSEGMGEAG